MRQSWWWMKERFSTGSAPCRLLPRVRLPAQAGERGRAVRVTRDRGKVRSSPLASRVVPTVHPSSILRAPDRRDKEMAAFVKDLRAVARLMRAGAAGD